VIPAVAQRTVIKANPKGTEAMPVFEVEEFDPETGERICKGWERLESDAEGRFTIPAPEYLGAGLKPEFAASRPGRYLLPEELPGRQF
jgi:hypothetical protein